MLRHCILITFLLLAFDLYSQPPTPDSKFERVVKQNIESLVLNENREVYFYIPDSYESDKSHSVLYILDGERTDRFKKAIKAAGKNKQLPKHIIVGIETKKHRNRDMITCKLDSRPSAGGGEQFYKFLTTELIPFIDSAYHTNRTNILYGASTAGLFTIYTMLQNPSQISGYIANSPMIGHCPDLITQLTKDYLGQNSNQTIHVFIQHGKKDHFKQATDYIPEFSRLLKTQNFEGLKLEYLVYKKRGHVSKGAFKNGLEFIYQKAH